jgi:hypothetical protein
MSEINIYIYMKEKKRRERKRYVTAIAITSETTSGGGRVNQIEVGALQVSGKLTDEGALAEAAIVGEGEVEVIVVVDAHEATVAQGLVDEGAGVSIDSRRVGEKSRFGVEFVCCPVGRVGV